MNNTRLSKLLSVILAVAICATTVFGCLMTVNAATPLSYEIVADEVTNLTQASASITFNVPEGMSAGMFDLANTANGDFAGVTAVITGGTKLNGEADIENDFATYEDEKGGVFNPFLISTEDLDDGDLARVIFMLSNPNAENLYTSVTFKFTITFDGEATKGAEYDLAINDLEFMAGYGGTNEVVYTDSDFEGSAAKISTGCEHVVVVNDEDLLKTDSVNGYAVYSKSSCAKCLEELGYQVVPTKVPAEQNVIYWDGTEDATLADTDAETGDSPETAIIIDSAEELAYLSNTSSGTSNHIDSTGKYFKIADGIDAIVLQPESDWAKAIMSLDSASAVQKHFEEADDSTNAKSWKSGGWSDAHRFAGIFDGNGVTIYGLARNATTDTSVGLFGRVDAGTTIKNVTLKNSYLASLTQVGGIVAVTNGATTLDGCIVANCFIRQYMSQETKNAAVTKASILVTNMTGNVTIRNCMIYGNDARNVGFENAAEDCVGFPLSMISTNGLITSISNVVCLGATPYSKYNQLYAFTGGNGASPFSNTYTDQPVSNINLYKYADGVIGVYGKINNNICSSLTATTAAEVKTEEFVNTLNENANATVFEAVNGDYPILAQEVAKPGSSAAENIIYATGDSAFETAGGFITEAAEGVGSSPENPYIITTSAELEYLVRLSTPEQTQGKFFKIADGIDALVAQNDYYLKEIGKKVKGVQTAEAGLEVIKNWTADEAKEYFTTNGGTGWWGSSNASAGSGVFCGTIDFNGITVYGMYARSGGLFHNVGAGASFKNVTVRGAYAVGDPTGIIAAYDYYAYNLDKTDKKYSYGTISFDNCVVADCSLTNTRKSVAVGRAGMLLGNFSYNRVDINNCLVYGSSGSHQGYYSGVNYDGVQAQYDVTYGLMGSVIAVNDVNSSITNSIILDCVPHAVYRSYAATTNMTFSNVYTNIAGTVITNIDYSVANDGTVTKIEQKLSPVINANGTYTPNISETNLTAGTLTGKITSTKPVGSVLAINAKDIKGLGGGAVVSALNTANDATVWATTASGYPTPLSKYADTISATSSNDLKLAAYNLTYNESGSFNLNYHYEPAYEGFAPELLIAKSDLSKLTALAPTESPYAGNGLSDDAIMYTIENISAREIEDTMLSTIIVANGDQAIWGKTEAISPKDYAIDVINGKAFYTKGGDAETIQKDKNVAAALINYGEAAKTALDTANDANANSGKTDIVYLKSSNGDGTFITGAAVGVGDTPENPYIISTVEHLIYIATTASISQTRGKYFKVADNIKAFILQKEEAVNNAGGSKAIMNLATPEAVKTYFTETLSNKTTWVVSQNNNGNGYFAGTIDFNNVTVYGMYRDEVASASGTGTVALVGSTDADAVIKNVTVTNSYIDCAGRMSAITTNSASSSVTGNEDGIVTIQNSVVTNCYFVSRHTTMNNAGILAGQTAYNSDAISIDTCMVYDNYAYSTTNELNLSLFGSTYSANSEQPSSITNTIVLGATPYLPVPSIGYWNSRAYYFSNVYSDSVNVDENGKVYASSSSTEKYVIFEADQISKINANDIKGSNAFPAMPNLDWSTWAYGANGEYPTPVKASTETEGKILYWDGGETQPTKTDGEGNILITTPAELYYLAKNGDTSAASKYKVADGIKAFVMQPESVVDTVELMSLADYSATKAYFDKLNAANAGLKSWTTKAANAATGTEFAGTFDGNGVEIYGLYYNKHSWASTGLFPHVGANVVIKNLAIKNSYLAIQSYAGALYGQSITGGNSDRIYIDSVEVSNSWFYNTEATTKNPGAENEYIQYFTNRTGILSGNTQGLISINNCIIYGNKIMNANNVELKLAFGTLKNSWTTTDLNHSYSNSIVLGQFPFDGTAYNSMLAGLFANVYTDQDTTTGRYKYTADQIAQVESADMIGGNAQTVVDAINNANGDSRDMYVGNAWGYPGFTQAGIMPSANQMAFDNLALTNTDIYKETNPEFSMYATSLNLKANPYIAFTFAFNGEYKADRDNISVTFTTASGEVTTTVGNGNGGVSTGWTNNAGAGRYHLYRLKDIDVKDLAAGITVTVNYGGDTYNFGTFSVEGFALDSANALKKNPDSQYYAANLNAAKALLYYVQTVSARYGA